jgi:hypothetical protein
MTLTIPDQLFNRLEFLAQVERRTPEELAYDRLRREVGEDTISSHRAKEVAKAFVRRRVGRCLTVRDPVLEEGGGWVWLVPVVTNVRREEAAFVGQVVVDARTEEVLTNEGEIAALFKRAHSNLGFLPFPAEKERRLSDLLSRAQEGPLTGEEREELDRLVTEQQALQLANLEQLDRRLLPGD